MPGPRPRELKQAVTQGWLPLIERRRSPRIDVHLPVLLLWEEGGREHREHTFTLNLSWFGGAVHSHKFFSPGTRVRLQRQDKTAEARIAYSLWDHATNIVEVGLGFDQDGREFWGIAVWSDCELSDRAQLEAGSGKTPVLG